MQNVEYNGEKYQLFATHEHKIQSAVIKGRLCFRVYADYWKYHLKVMQKILILESSSGELFHCRIVKLQDRQFMQESFFYACKLEDTNQVLQQFKE